MIAAFLVMLGLAAGLALWARRGHDLADPRAFFAARGQFGTLLYFMLAVGETYSIGSILGFPAGVSAHGTRLALWFAGYILLAFPIGFVLYPMMWQAGRDTGAITLPDLFGRAFASRALERAVAIVLLVLMLPLGTMQFIGVGAVMAHVAPALPSWAGIAVGAGIAFAFTAAAGLRAPAIVAVLKDSVMLGAIAIVAIMAALRWGGHATIGVAEALHPQQGLSSHDAGFILSTIAVQSVAFCFAPQASAAVFSARGPDAIRRAQVFMPLYMLLFPALFLIATFAMTHGVHGNDAFLWTAGTLLPRWAFGIVLAATLLTAIVWLGAVCLAIAAIVARNLVRGLPPHTQKRVGLAATGGYLALSVLGAVWHGTLLTDLNTLFYLGLVQIVPGAIAALRRQRLTPASVMLGIAGGFAVAFLLRHADNALWGINPALIGVLVNAAILRVTGRIALQR